MQNSEITTEDLFKHFKTLAAPADDYSDSILENKLIDLLNKETKVTNLDKPITFQELTKTIRQLKNRKATGPDCISNEMIKYSGDTLKESLLKLFNLTLTSTTFPDSWCHGYIVALHKSGDKSDPTNYRGITLSSCIGKLFTQILNNRLTTFIESCDIMHEAQAGFRPKARTADHILILKYIIQQAKQKKKKVYACFVDLKKAFDTVWHTGALYALLQAGCSTQFTLLIQNMYSKLQSCIRLDNIRSEFFPIKVGTRQGCNLSPIIFNLFINKLPQYLDNIATQPFSIMDHRISSLLYADDIVLLSQTPMGLQCLLNGLQTFCHKWKLKVNIKKTKILIFNSRNTSKLSFWYQNSKLEQCTSYTYLGILLTPNGTFKSAKRELVKKGKRAMFALKQNINIFNGASPRLMTRLFDVLIKPILLYGSEVWGLMDLSLQATSLDNLLTQDINPTIEKLHLRFCKQTLGIKLSSSNNATLAELGRYPLICSIIPHTTKYLFHILMITSNNKPLKTVANLMLNNSKFAFSKVHDILQQCGKWEHFKNNMTPHQLRPQCAKLKDIIQSVYRQHVTRINKKQTKLQQYWTLKNMDTYKTECYLNILPIKAIGRQ